MPRWVPAYIWLVVVLNAAAWLGRVVPGVLDADPTAWSAGTGLTTNPAIVQDLAFWLPAMAWLGRDVWRADPASTWASPAAVPMFGMLAFVGLLPMRRLIRAATGRDSPRPARVPVRGSSGGGR